ncbi:MAG: glycosyltransferase [Candidatus Baldrarchaeia archaeon]
MGDDSPKIIACIPAYNEEKTITKVVLQVRKYVDKVAVYNDGPTDMTSEIAETLSALACLNLLKRNPRCG